MESFQQILRSRYGLVIFSISLLFAALGWGFGGTASAMQNPTLTPQVQLPTATHTAVGGPTATPSRTPTITPVLAEAVGKINLRSGPGMNFDIVGELEPGVAVPVIGRSVQFPWLMIVWEDAPNGTAWVFLDLVVITYGDLTSVPIVDEPEAPTADATQAAIIATATVLQQTPGAPETATAVALFAPTGIYTLTPGGVEVAGSGSGLSPTFTSAPPPQPAVPPVVQANNDTRRGIPPGPIIISLGLMGLLTLAVGMIRRVG